MTQGIGPTVSQFVQTSKLGDKVVYDPQGQGNQALQAKGHSKTAHFFTSRSAGAKTRNTETINAFIQAVKNEYGDKAADSVKSSLQDRLDKGRPLTSRAIKQALQLKNIFGKTTQFALNEGQTNLIKQRILATKTDPKTNKPLPQSVLAQDPKTPGLSRQFLSDIRDTKFIVDGTPLDGLLKHVQKTEDETSVSKAKIIKHTLEQMMTSRQGSVKNPPRDLLVLTALLNQDTLASFMMAQMDNAFRGDDLFSKYINGPENYSYSVSMGNNGYVITVDFKNTPTSAETPGSPHGTRVTTPLDPNQSYVKAQLTLTVPFAPENSQMDDPLPDIQVRGSIEHKFVRR